MDFGLATLNFLSAAVYNTQVDDLDLFSWKNGVRALYAGVAGGIAGGYYPRVLGDTSYTATSNMFDRFVTQPAIAGVIYGGLSKVGPKGKGKFWKCAGEGITITEGAEAARLIVDETYYLATSGANGRQHIHPLYNELRAVTKSMAGAEKKAREQIKNSTESGGGVADEPVDQQPTVKNDSILG
jgi:hypothetical protein